MAIDAGKYRLMGFAFRRGYHPSLAKPLMTRSRFLLRTCHSACTLDWEFSVCPRSLWSVWMWILIDQLWNVVFRINFEKNINIEILPSRWMAWNFRKRKRSYGGIVLKMDTGFLMRPFLLSTWLAIVVCRTSVQFLDFCLSQFLKALWLVYCYAFWPKLTTTDWTFYECRWFAHHTRPNTIIILKAHDYYFERIL